MTTQLTDAQLIECIPTVTLGKDAPVRMVWLQQRDALKAMRAAIELHEQTKKVEESNVAKLSGGLDRPSADPCTHTKTVGEWVEEEETFYGVEAGRWDYREECTYEDIDVGRFRCTQCKEVFYYTGLWREHWEGGRQLLDERTGNVKSIKAR